MPQLDRYLVFSEVFWFIILFLISYIFIYYFLLRFFYVIKIRSLIFFISQSSSDSLRKEKRYNLFIIPRYIENNLLKINLMDTFLLLEKTSFRFYKLFLANSITRDFRIENYSNDLFNRLALIKVFSKIFS
jgi:hypothetical protein